MLEQQDLFDTFDQLVTKHQGKLEGKDLSPNVRIPGEVILEPVMKGIRVTARDDEHRVLWGFIGSEEMLTQAHCPVAIYETLQRILAQTLANQSPATAPESDSLDLAQTAISSLTQTVSQLQKSLQVKKVTKATQERARVIARIANDANRMIELEASSLKGMKPKVKPAGCNTDEG